MAYTTFIYSEAPEAFAIREALRDKGQDAFVRNPQYFNPEDFNADCNAVVTWHEAIRDAFEARNENPKVTKKVIIDFRGAAEEVKPEESGEVGDAAAETEAEAKPKRTAKKKSE